MTARERTPDLYVLDTLADDIEDLITIMRALNSDTAIGWHRVWGRHFTREEVVSALSRLITSDLVQVAVLTSDGTALEKLAAGQLPPGDYSDVWFAMTPRGRLVHANWHPDIPAEPS
jgi:hypothetical protein